VLIRVFVKSTENDMLIWYSNSRHFSTFSRQCRIEHDNGGLLMGMYHNNDPANIHNTLPFSTHICSLSTGIKIFVIVLVVVVVRHVVMVVSY